MRVLVLGGTGAMGVHLVQLLSNSSIESVVTSRKKRQSEGNIKYLQGDAHDLHFLQSVLTERWDAIVDFMVYNTENFEESVKIILKFTNQYIFLSSARVYANKENPIVETSPRLLDVSMDNEFLNTEEYSLAKARQEDILYNLVNKNWTIIRPYITYSENRLQLGVLEKEEWLYRALMGRTIVFSEDINTKLSTLTYGLDVAKGIMATIGRVQALGQAFHITTNESITWEGVLTVYLQILEKHLGYRPKVLLTNSKQFFKTHPAKYQIDYDRLFNRQFNNAAIAEFIDVNNFKSTECGLKECLENFIVNGRFENINWQMEAIKDRQTCEKTPLKEIDGMIPKIKYLIFRYVINK